MKSIIIKYFLILFYSNVAFAQFSVADVFTDNMVLQRNRPIHIYGKGIPEKEVVIKFLSKNKKVRVAKDSTWHIYYKKQKACLVPQSIIIASGNTKIIVENILIGDVWLCIGQSNMEWPMLKEKYYLDEKKVADRPLLRFYNATYAGKGVYNESYSDSILQLLHKDKFYKGKWQVSDTNSIKKMSAVAYYFGKEILVSENIPIGLINLAIGGCPIESFMDEKVLLEDSRFSKKAKGNWLENNALPVWVRERGRQNIDEVIVRHSDEYGPNHPYKPGLAYKAGIVPLLNTPIKGVIWYQGESNAQEPARVFEYRFLLKKMITDYRKKWKLPKMPFYWAQLSSIDTIKYNSKYWPEFRNEQRKLMDDLAHGGMAVTSDIGLRNNVHPTNKRDVGIRLAYWALQQSYKRTIVPSGPLPLKAVYRSGKVKIFFNYVANGLKISGGKDLVGFSLDGKEHTRAVIKDNTIEISVKRKPEYVYYGWRPYTNANLINSSKLPASTFKITVY
ncbi:MAG: sialate O-acetylesterase [Cellulophaga sp.]